MNISTTEDLRDLVSNTRNATEDTASMYEVMTDFYPGIEKCVNEDLTIRNNCTPTGMNLNPSRIKGTPSKNKKSVTFVGSSDPSVTNVTLFLFEGFPKFMNVYHT